MKGNLFWIAMIFLTFSSCGSTETKTDSKIDSVELGRRANPLLNGAVRNGITNSGGVYHFDPNIITKEEKEVIRVDLNDFVSRLNTTIKQKRYSDWLAHLTPSYQTSLASKENLRQASQADRLKARNISLANLFDYFINVVVPSRSNGRVDDIEFVSETRVKAYMIVNGQRLRLYELERVGDTWKISN
jgi:hypothetical protein